MSDAKVISVVVPVYGSERILSTTYARLTKCLAAFAPEFDYEIVFVNDASPDGALDVLRGLAASDPRVRLVSLSRNFGHQIAITAGMDVSEGDVVVIIDDDLQDPPEVIAAMLDKWRQGYKVVYGVRVHRNGESVLKRASAKAFYRLIQWLSDTPLPLDAGDFRLMDRQVVDALGQMREESRYMRGMVAWVGFSQAPVYYERDARFEGTGNYSFRKLTALALDGVLSFSSRPLALSTQLGAMITVLAFLYGSFLLIDKLLHPSAILQGWTSMIVVVIFIGGVQLLSVGVLGSYLGRIFYETKKRPLYLVAERHNLDVAALPHQGHTE